MWIEIRRRAQPSNDRGGGLARRVCLPGGRAGWELEVAGRLLRPFLSIFFAALKQRLCVVWVIKAVKNV